MTKIRLLLTSVGGLVAPSMIRGLKNCAGYDFYIVGVDAQKGAVGFHYVDKSYVVPGGQEAHYFQSIYDICLKEKIDFVIPLSDEEALSISRGQNQLKTIGTTALCSEPSVVEAVIDKGRMLTLLRQRGLRTPNFYLVNSLSELDKAVKILDYPDNDVVIKPCRGSGARGFWRLSGNVDNTRFLWQDRVRQRVSYKCFREIAEKATTAFPEIIAMEFLGGADFNIDVLTLKGQMLAICPMERIAPEAGPIQVGRIVKDDLIEEEVKSIVREFGFSYNVNIEVAYRNDNNDEPPFVYEINPRPSGAIAVSAAAGQNLLLSSILLAGGKEQSTEHFKAMQFQRWYEYSYY